MHHDTLRKYYVYLAYVKIMVSSRSPEQYFYHGRYLFKPFCVTAFLSFRSHPHLLLSYLLIAGILQQQPHFLLILSSPQISLPIVVTLKETITASVFVNCFYDQHHCKTIWVSSVASLPPIKGLHFVSFYSLGV